MPEAQVVERDHPHKDDGERKDLKGSDGNWTLILMLAQITCFNIEGSTGSSGKLTRLGNLVANHLETIEWLTITKVLSSQSALNSACGFT